MALELEFIRPSTIEILRPCLVDYLNNIFYVFKQHYTLFHILFHPHVFQKTINNITQTPLPNGSLKLQALELDSSRVFRLMNVILQDQWESLFIRILRRFNGIWLTLIDDMFHNLIGGSSQTDTCTSPFD